MDTQQTNHNHEAEQLMEEQTVMVAIPAQLYWRIEQLVGDPRYTVTCWLEEEVRGLERMMLEEGSDNPYIKQLQAWIDEQNRLLDACYEKLAGDQAR